MTRFRPFAALALVTAAAAFAWPITAAIPVRDAVTVRVASATVAILVCATVALYNRWGRRTAIAVTTVFAAIGISLLLMHFDALSTCVVEFEGRQVIVGTVHTPLGLQNLEAAPDLSASELLFDAGGMADLVWTGDSIRQCRLLVSWAGLAALPFLAGSVGMFMSHRRYTFGAFRPVTTSTAVDAGIRPVYDAFMSYRHLEPDRTIAFDLVETLEASGLRAAIDARDFSPNEHFLSEMERCIKQSRFVLCVITAQYVQSDHTSEEAIISKTLDLAQRRKRLVPLIYERVELPIWLHGLVGIDCTTEAGVDPHQRLIQLLKQDTLHQRVRP